MCVFVTQIVCSFFDLYSSFSIHHLRGHLRGDLRGDLRVDLRVDLRNDLRGIHDANKEYLKGKS